VRSPLSVAQRETPGAPLSVEVAQALHGELSAIRDFIEDHLGPLEKIARGEAPGAQASTRARSAPEEEMAAAAVNAKPPSTGHSVRGTPLLRARHRLPPQPGAFRAAPKDGHEAWYVFDTERRCYELVKE
jgi:hypothetical protein